MIKKKYIGILMYVVPVIILISFLAKSGVLVQVLAILISIFALSAWFTLAGHLFSSED